MLKVFINGSSGKMGLSLINLINQNKGFNLISDDISLSDVVIDFSHPNSTLKIVKECCTKEIPLIIGTTGLNKKILNEITNASNNIPILLASNMSIGILQLKKSIHNFLKHNENKIDCFIEEVHHSKKIDSPSGTAIEINDFIDLIDDKKNVSAIKINSKRVDDVFGIHKITFINEETSIYFKHEALSRDIFATGALECAANIHKLEPNLYNFEDIIN